MKKYLVFLLLILLSCQKDEIIIEPTPTTKLIFEMGEVSIQDGQDISFEVITNTQHQLIISTQEGSVITKETFTPILGLNTRQLYTKSLPKGQLILSLHSDNELGKTVIIVE